MEWLEGMLNHTIFIFLVGHFEDYSWLETNENVILFWGCCQACDFTSEFFQWEFPFTPDIAIFRVFWVGFFVKEEKSFWASYKEWTVDIWQVE